MFDEVDAQIYVLVDGDDTYPPSAVPGLIYKPLLFFSGLSGLLLLATLAAGLAPILDYVRARYVIHVPLAILATGTGILSALSLTIGLILHTISRYQNELRAAAEAVQVGLRGPPTRMEDDARAARDSLSVGPCRR